MDDDERLLALMNELTSRPEYATGVVPFPRPLAPLDAAAIQADLQAGIDRAVEKRAEQIAAEGATVACGPGCNRCCEQAVGVWAGEAELVAAWLDQPEHADVRAAFLAAYPSWRERSRPTIEKIRDAPFGPSQGRALANHWRKRLLCPFNHGGLCTIYEVRPIVCRTAHALETAERCLPDDELGSRAEIMHFVPLERLVDKATVLSQAVHHAVKGPRREPVVLADAVAERLT